MNSTNQFLVVAGVATACAFGNWLADGRPSGMPAEQLDTTPLREGEVRLEELLAGSRDGLLWIDARKPEQWRSDGLEGSINLSPLADEPLDAQLAPHLERLLEAHKLVIYCDGLFCSLSHDLAGRLQADFPELIGGEIVVLHGGAEALRAAGMLD